MKRPKKRGAGLTATEPQIKNLTGKNTNLSIELLQVRLIKSANLHSSVKNWGKPHWLTLEFEEYVSKTNNKREEGIEK